MQAYFCDLMPTTRRGHRLLSMRLKLSPIEGQSERQTCSDTFHNAYKRTTNNGETILVSNLILNMTSEKRKFADMPLVSIPHEKACNISLNAARIIWVETQSVLKVFTLFSNVGTQKLLCSPFFDGKKQTKYQVIFFIFPCHVSLFSSLFMQISFFGQRFLWHYKKNCRSVSPKLDCVLFSLPLFARSLFHYGTVVFDGVPFD